MVVLSSLVQLGFLVIVEDDLDLVGELSLLKFMLEDDAPVPARGGVTEDRPRPTRTGESNEFDIERKKDCPGPAEAIEVGDMEE